MGWNPVNMIVGAVGGFVVGGPAGAVAGAVAAGAYGEQNDRDTKRQLNAYEDSKRMQADASRKIDEERATERRRLADRAVNSAKRTYRKPGYQSSSDEYTNTLGR